MSSRNSSTRAIFILALLIIFTQSLQSQTTTVTIGTDWSDNDKTCEPCLYDRDQGKVWSSQTIKIPFRGSYEFSYEVKNITYRQIAFSPAFDKSMLPDSPDVQVNFGQSRHENFVIVDYSPLISKQNGVQIVESFVLEITGTPKTDAQDRDHVFAPTSVLASGDWYKIGVAQDGIYKLTYETLFDLGINPGTIHPNHINIYGNHIPELPYDNGAYHPDDLIKNAIFISGDGDGSFDSGDYALFYAKGPNPITTNAASVEARKNKIDSLTYYFIHIDPSDPPKRLTSTSNAVGAATHTVNTTNDFILYEKNEQNLLKSGTGWFGDYFDINLEYSFPFQLKDLVLDENIYLKTAMAMNNENGTLKYRVFVNGVQVDENETAVLGGEYTVAKILYSSLTLSGTSSDFTVKIQLERSNPASHAWLDYIQVGYKRWSRMSDSPLFIRHLASVGPGNIGDFSIGNAGAGTRVWEITDPTGATVINGTLSGTNYTFKQSTDSLRTYVAFYDNQALLPITEGKHLGRIPNQNLHGLPQVDYLIVTHESLLPQAERLANLHRAQGTSVHVTNIQHVYNEFGGGAADPVAVRWFAKMFYDRAAGDPSAMPKYLCLFGDGSYDPLNRISNNNYLLPTFNSLVGDLVNFSSSYTSDDFFAILDDDESMLDTDLMDIAVGRITASDIETATDIVNKIEHYMKNGSGLYASANGAHCDDDGTTSTFGDWRNRVVLIADDVDEFSDKRFVSDCESLSDTTQLYHPEMNVVKIYLDAYKQVVTSGGQRYPEAVEKINQNIDKGALVFNYVGHGGETGLALERIVSIPQIKEWTNVHKLPIFVSATCEFSRFDDPNRISAGETMLSSPFGGGIGLLTTTRLVRTDVNAFLVRNLYNVMFLEENGKGLPLGEITRRTKNLSSTVNSHYIRNFSLLGDPALRLAKAGPKIVTDSINGVSVTMATDTVKALSKITVKGHFEGEDGTPLSGYDGVVYPTIYDKQKIKQTLGQDVDNTVLSFYTQNNIIYKGKSTVKNGEFVFSFVVPKDIDYEIGKGKISYYGNNESSDHYGYDTTIVVGGINPDGIADDIGPEIELFMNDEHFVNGGLTDSKPIFLAHIKDENGINTTGNGIGHNITLILDGNTAEPIILNNFYEADLDTYQSGKVSYRLNDLEPGKHQLIFKVWDVNNNSSEATLDFVVQEEEEIGITRLLNYPNPFTTNTDFYFEHNQVCNSLDVKVEIFTVSGKLVKTIVEKVHASGFRSEGINWDGRDDFGDKLGRGVYVYRLSIVTEQGQKAEKIEKLVIL